MNNIKDINRRVKLENVETGQMYDLILKKSDYVRVLTDDEFTNSMLQHAKVVHPEAVPILMPSPEGNESGESSDAKNENEDCDNMEENSDVQNNSSTSNCKVLYSWQYDQVIALINVMGNHIHDLDNPRKRKDVFESVTNDLISMKYNVNLAIVQNKWKSLIKSYKKAKDNKLRTGFGPSRFNFYESMDALLGENLAKACAHSINSHDDKRSTSLETAANVEFPTDDEEPSSKRRKKRKTVETVFKKEYLELKRDEYRKRQKRHEEKMAIEKRKLALLEKYLLQMKKK